MFPVPSSGYEEDDSGPYPTIALMNDQTVAMIEKGIWATYLGSTQKDSKVEEKVAAGKFDLVYVEIL